MTVESVNAQCHTDFMVILYFYNPWLKSIELSGQRESVSNKCEVVYIKEKNLDDYISKTAKLEGGINIINNRDT